jgi:hypothetical protein
MKKTLLIAIFIALSITSYGQDMKKYLSDTRELVKQKEYKKALKRYIWFQDHALENDPAMVGVRLSFALSNWKSLADIYPPAMAALKEMRNNKTKEVLDDNASTKLFADVAALNRTLGEGDKTIELFENIEKEHPDKAKLCWYWIKDALFDAKRYDIIKNYIGNPVNEFTLLKSQYDLLNAVQIEQNKKRPELKVFADNNFAEKSLKLIEFSVAVDDLKSAKEIREKAMTVVTDNRLRDFKIE